ncbi:MULTISPECIES: hypothetical protein [Streptomyces]|uniref:hypothetical protein n=1 Tax=Streptomyces TaxID=1883 RepID=UPI0022AE5ABA|nr:hypothetical protein [Streptomyces sp. H39-C1]MCZ4103591.1 hypothetical protein [Streptomyces sp. H39-C1]
MDATQHYPEFLERPDGNYQHPTNPSKMLSVVAREHVYEQDRPEGMQFGEDGGEI